MGSLGNPQTWVPYENTKDCSQGFCSLSCPQWCYIIFPPPPPFVFPEEDPSPSFSPLVIAIIGILASAFLLVSYYTFISKYCGSLDSLRRGANHDPSEEFHENRDRSPMNEEPWQVSVTGLDEALIKSITVCKYKKGDGLVEETDCSVCLNEFQEDESLRLLPKCSHAFHLICIDTWLKSHPNCPLCRANIVSASSLPLQSLPPVHESPPEAGSAPESRNENNMIIVVEDSERVDGEEASQGRDSVPKTPLHGSSDLGVVDGDTIIEIRDEDAQLIRRSVSMDPSCQSRISIADILVMSQDDDSEMEDRQSPVEVGSSKRQVGEHSKSNYRSRGLHCVMSPIAMKRSFSGGRFLFTRHGRGRNTTITM